MTKKRVFITGATGNMGGAALKELLGRRDRFDIVLLARPGKKNIKKLKYLKDEPGVDIIWGDLTDYDSVLNGVTTTYCISEEWFPLPQICIRSAH